MIPDPLKLLILIFLAGVGNKNFWIKRRNQCLLKLSPFFFFYVVNFNNLGPRKRYMGNAVTKRKVTLLKVSSFEERIGF